MRVEDQETLKEKKLERLLETFQDQNSELDGMIAKVFQIMLKLKGQPESFPDRKTDPIPDNLLGFVGDMQKTLSNYSRMIVDLNLIVRELDELI